MLWPAIDPGLHTFYERTIAYQADRNSPFSIWGQVGLEPLRLAILAAVGALSIALAFWPKRKTLTQVAALGAALLIGLQITAQHWFYLYIVWFYPCSWWRWRRGRKGRQGTLDGRIFRAVQPISWTASSRGGPFGGRLHHLLDRVRQSRRVDLDHRAHHPDVLLGGFEADRHLGGQRLPPPARA